MNIGLILLAAGKGERFGSSKLETSLNGRPIIEYILCNIPIDSFSHSVIVTANKNILNIASKYGIHGIINDHPDLGIAKSIKMGTEHIRDADAYMYCVSDQPMLKKSTVLGMINTYEDNTILALSHSGKRGNPVIFPSYLYNELVSLKINESGQKVIKHHMDILKLYEIEDNTQLMDIDTRENYNDILNIINKQSS